MAAPLLALGLSLFEAVPTLLRVFGKNRPAEVVEKVGALAHTIAGTENPAEAIKTLNANPELMQKFIAEADQRAMEWTRLYIEDTQDARKRDIELAKMGIKNDRANILVAVAFVMVILCFAVVVWMSDLNEYTKGIITLILGRALGWVEQIFSFEFGTTRSSKHKDETINSLSKE